MAAVPPNAPGKGSPPKTREDSGACSEPEAFARAELKRLRGKVRQLEKALREEREKTLGGIIHVCSSCRKVRAADHHWMNWEYFLEIKTGIRLSHGLCPGCAESLCRDELER